MMRRPSGFTLAEVLVWIMVLSLFLSMVAMVTVSGMDGASRARKALQQTETEMAAWERIGEDVRNSTAIIARGDERKSDATTLVLESPGAGRVTYIYGNGKLTRETRVKEKTRVSPLALPEGCEFRYDARGPGESSWVEVRTGSGKKARVARFGLMTAEGAP